MQLNATLWHTKQTTKLLLRAPAISPGFVFERCGHPPPPNTHTTSWAVRLRVRLLLPPSHRFTHSSGVYTKKGSVLPWAAGRGARGGKSAIAKTALSEAHYSGGYLYLQLRWIFGDDPLENQGKKSSEMAPLERSWRWGRTF
jgi:hypothetical protein